MKVEQNNLLRAIETIVTSGNVVIQIKDLFAEDLFFLAMSFNPSEFNTAASVDFHYLKGINITEFLDNNMNLYNNPTALIAGLDKTIDEGIVVDMQISKGCRWCKYSK